MIDLAGHMQALAAYRTWANQRLYSACADLSEADYRRPAGVYFSSMHGTLNHLLAVDRIWMRRLTGKGQAPDTLDAILFETFEDLRVARAAEDRRIESYVADVSPAELTAVFDYATTRGQLRNQPRFEALAHLFNHQTHHRGQAHAVLTRLGVAEPPALDMVLMQRERAGAAAP